MRTLRTASAFALALALAACGSSGGSEDHSGHDDAAISVDAAACRPAMDGVVTLTAEGLAYDASCLAVPAGAPSTIRFVNLDGTPHDVMVEDAEGMTIIEGENVADGTISYDLPALEPGDYPFHCHIHPSMQGVIRAVA